MELKGMIEAVMEPVSGVTANGEWKRREFVVIHGSAMYPKKTVFTLSGGNVDKFNDILIKGKKVNVKFDIDAREYQGRWFNSVSAWSVEETNPQSTTSENSDLPI